MEIGGLCKYLTVYISMLVVTSGDVRNKDKTINKRSLGQIHRSWKYNIQPFWRHLWEPEKFTGQTRADWLRCRGMNCKEWDKVKVTMNEIKQVQNIINNDDQRTVAKDGRSSESNSADDNDIRDGCSLLTKEQAGVLLGNMRTAQRMIANIRQKRTRRKIENFKYYPQAKWARTIFYKFDGKHSRSEQEHIRGALRHWEAQTCIRFFEVNTIAPLGNLHHILITNEPNGCYSYVGKVDLFPQPVNLADACLRNFGTAVHEIGHALGMWHEHQRPDRDNFVRIKWDNIGGLHSQYWPKYLADTLNVAYDAGSVMHYSGKTASKNGMNTMETINPLYQKSMGQRLGLSFTDAKVINKAYCALACWTALPKACKRGGYQDPNNCGQCRCPDGFGGRYCEEVQKPVGADCSHKIVLNTWQTRTIQSPGYKYEGYQDRQECNWLILAPENYRVSVEFEDDFAIYCESLSICLHWLEVRYHSDLGKPGPRFCCYQRPDPLVSETREMLMVMRANYTLPEGFSNSRRGFRARVRAVPMHGPNPTSSTSSTTASTTSLPPGSQWGAWGRCQNHECKCGGYSTSRRHLLCGSQRCTGTLARFQEKSCDRLCESKDTYLIYNGKFQEVDCLTCGPGFRPDRTNNRCIPSI